MRVPWLQVVGYSTQLEDKLCGLSGSFNDPLCNTLLFAVAVRIVGVFLGSFV